MSRPTITPELKVGAFLQHYPELEATLVAQAREFEKLTNPVLRRTVAKVATLAAAARVGGIEPHALVRSLREAAGQGAAQAGDDDSTAEHDDRPDWVDAVRIVDEIDADALLDAGATPLGAVLGRALGLEPGQALIVRSAFRPQPLVDALRERGLEVHCSTADGGATTTTVRRAVGRQGAPDPTLTGDPVWK